MVLTSARKTGTAAGRQAWLARFPWLLTFGRMGLFAAVQGLFALGFAMMGSNNGWDQSVAWWPYIVSVANLICLGLLVWLFRAEGKSFWSLFRIRRSDIAGDLLVLAASMFLIGPVSYFPNIWLSTLLFGDPTAVLEHFIQPLPILAVYGMMIIFPLSQAIVETPLYFNYALPRLRAQGVPGWLALLITGLMLGLQHGAAPLVLQANFFTWRVLMFVPFGLITAAIVMWRPRLQPYVSAIHFLMNLSFLTMFLPSAY